MAEKGSLVSKMFSEKWVIAGVVIGILLVWISLLIIQFSTGADVLKATRTLRYTGVALVSIMLISGGIASKDEKNVRTAMVVMGVLVLLALILGWVAIY